MEIPKTQVTRNRKVVSSSYTRLKIVSKLSSDVYRMVLYGACFHRSKSHHNVPEWIYYI